MRMIREDLENIPQFMPPSGFGLRWYGPGDESRWLDIHLKADRYNTITAKLFFGQFGTDSSLLAKRQCYLLDRVGNAIGTATAWFDDKGEPGRMGRVHWVALVPEYQGRGLSKPLMTAVCVRLRELGHRQACLTTSSARRPAIYLYLRVGFAPLIQNDAEAEIWRRILQSC